MATRLPGWLRQHLAGLRILLVLTVLLGLAYPLVVTGIAQIPGLKSRAHGRLVTDANGGVGSSLIGQAFTDKDGNPLRQYRRLAAAQLLLRPAAARVHHRR